jgi:hypothetical protein
MRGAAFLPSALVAILLLSGCTVVEEKRAPGSRREEPEQIFLDARVELQEGSLVRGVMRARRMEQQRKRSTVRMVGDVEVVSWDDLGRVESLTLCDTLLYRRDRQDLSAGGHVRMMAASDPEGRRLDGEGQIADLASLRRRPPFQLQTSHLDWVQRIQRVETKDMVVFYTPYDTLRGKGFSSDRRLRNWEIGTPMGVTHRVRDQKDTDG